MMMQYDAARVKHFKQFCGAFILSEYSRLSLVFWCQGYTSQQKFKDIDSGKDDSIDDASYNIDNNKVSEVESNLEFIKEEEDDEVPM
ncbi:hypothetical protein FQA39_LY07118 [Lamprigera yunnana]|nr:hypothetical protein FQA39_LY07118 [Lamprigera yunnana]